MPRFPTVVLLVGGIVMLVAGGAAVTLGLTESHWLISLVPKVVIDQSAVGGAAVALGTLVGGAGLVQLALGAVLRRGGPWIEAAAATVAGLLAAVAIGLTAVLITETVAGGSPLLLPAAGLTLVAGLAYGASAVTLARRSA